MAELYFSAKVDEDSVLCLSPLSEKKAEMVDEKIEDRSGYFLYELTSNDVMGEIEILARVTSDEAAVRLKNLLGLK
jgi:hypothetical protein